MFSTKTTNDFLTGRSPVVYPAGCEVVAQRFNLPMTTTDLTLNNLGNIGILPAGCVPVAVVFDADKLDNGTGLQFVLGVSNAPIKNNTQGLSPTDVSVLAIDGGAAWTANMPTAQTGGQAPFYSKALSRTQAANYDRYLVLKVAAAAATPVAGDLGVTLLYRAV